jgi:hypothetical protein
MKKLLIGLTALAALGNLTSAQAQINPNLDRFIKNAFAQDQETAQLVNFVVTKTMTDKKPFALVEVNAVGSPVPGGKIVKATRSSGFLDNFEVIGGLQVTAGKSPEGIPGDVGGQFGVLLWDSRVGANAQGGISNKSANIGGSLEWSPFKIGDDDFYVFGSRHFIKVDEEVAPEIDNIQQTAWGIGIRFWESSPRDGSPYDGYWFISAGAGPRTTEHLTGQKTKSSSFVVTVGTVGTFR